MLKMVDEFLPAEFTSSMARDVAAVRPPEVGRLNGAVVRFGDAAGIATPANARIRNELLPLHLRCRPCR
jgi:2-dehydropantoate 2-reductase